MWVGQKTEQLFEEMCSLACNEHKQQVVLLQDYNKLVKMKKKIFWMMKIHIMDPFFFKSNYNEVPENWISQSSIVFKDCSFPLHHETNISCEFKEKIVLYDSVSTFTLAWLSKVCCICENLEEESDVVEYYDMKFCTKYADDLSALEQLDLQGALMFVNKLPLFKDIRVEFDGYDKETVYLSFLIAYYYFLDISNDPYIALNYFEEVFDDVREEMKNNDIKDKGNEEYKKQNYKLAINAYSSGLSLSCYSYYLLGNRAQTYLKLDNHPRAELDCRAAIILRPEWSKGYYRLAQSLVGQKKVHEAHVVADFGLKNSNVLPLVEYDTLKEYKKSLLSECEICQNSKSSPNNKKDVSKIKLPDFETCSDVPELIESSSSDCTESESDSDNEKKNSKKKRTEEKSVCEDSPKVQLRKDDEDLALHEVEDMESVTNIVKSELDMLQKAISDPVPVEDIPDLIDSSSGSESDLESGAEEKCPIHDNDSSETSAVIVNKNRKDATKEESKRLSQEMLATLCSKDDKETVLSECKKERERKDSSSETKSKKLEAKQLEAKPKVSPEPDPAELEDNKLKNFSKSLTDGSSALINNCTQVAMYHFNEALSQIKTNPEQFQLGKDDIIALKYSYATACCKSGCLEDLLKAISSFKEIISEDSDVHIPAAYYGLALCYYKMNNFKEALNYLKILESSIENGANFKTFNYPGTDTLIEETSREKLKILMEDLTKKCECPPPSDALCRYEQCSLQPVIYFSDPDFKGFVSLHCNERCLLQYHVTCWKSVKDVFDRSDKEFLDSHCITPDCGGFIVKVEIYGKNGSIEKSFESEEGKPRKNIKHKKTKLEKKFEIREMRKSKRQRTSSLSESQKTSQVTPETAVEPAVPAEKPKPEVEEDKVSEKEKLNFAECPQQVVPVVHSDLSATAKPFYVIKKGIENKEPELKPKHKEKKRQKKSTLSIDEFCGDYSASEDLSYYSEYRLRLHRLQETRRVIEENDDNTWPTFCESERIPELDPNRPFHIPEGLRNDPVTLESVLQSYAPVTSEHSKALKDYIYPRFDSILQKRRTLYLGDPIVKEELDRLPQEWKDIIEESGGFKSFMLQSMRFAVVGETLCFFSEMLNLYNPSKLDEFTEMYDCESLPLGSDTSSSLFRIEGTVSDLNPNAAEYSPSTSDSKSDNSLEPGSCVSVSSSDSILSSAQCQVENSGEVGHSVASASNSEGYANSATCLADIYAGEQTATESQPSADIASDEKSLLTLLTNLRRPLSKYSLASETPKEGGSALVENAESSSANSKTDCLTYSKSKQLIEKLLVLKSHLAQDHFSCQILESMCELCSNDVIDSAKDHAPNVQHVEQADKCEQAGTPEITLISEGVMKEDEELNETHEKLASLTVEYDELSDKKKTLEEQLVESLDTISRLQNKFSVELTSVEKKLTETEALRKEESKAHKTKISSLEKEIKQWRQKHDIACDSEKDCKKENTKLQVKINNCISKLEEMNRKCDEYEEKLANKSIIVEKCEKVVQENGQLMEKWKKENAEAVKSARKAEVELLRLKRTTFLQKLDTIIMSGNHRIQELQTNISKAEYFSLQRFLAAGLKEFLCQLKLHAQEILKVRMNTQKTADELIAKVEEGVPLAELEEFVFPSLPQFPNMNECIPRQTEPNIPLQTTVSLNSQVNAALTDQQNTSTLINSGNNCLSYQQQLGLNQMSGSDTASQLVARRTQEMLMSQLQYQNSMGLNPQMNSMGLNPQVNQFSNYPSLFPNQVTSAYSQPSTHVPPKQPNTLLGTSFFSNSVSSNGNALNLVLPPGLMPATAKESAVTPATTTEAVQCNKAGSEPKVPSKSASIERESSESAIVVSSTHHHHASRSSSASSENIESNKDVEESGSVYSFHSLPSLQSSRNASNPVPSETNEARSQKSGSFPAPASEISGESATLELGYSNGTESEPPVRGAERGQASTNQAQSSQQQKVCSSKTEKKSSYTKILAKLSARYSDIPDADLLGYIRQFRDEKTKLTGMTIDSIVSGVSQLVESDKKQQRQPPAPIFRTKAVVNKPLVSAPPRPQPQPPARPSNENPWVKSKASEKADRQWTGDEDDDHSCAICLEDMTINIQRVECGHKFHHSCIKMWLNKNSNCPKCRVHLLLPEDYPELK